MSDTRRDYSLVVDNATPPLVIVHGGAGSYLATTTAAQRAARGERAEDRLAAEEAQKLLGEANQGVERITRFIAQQQRAKGR